MLAGVVEREVHDHRSERRRHDGDAGRIVEEGAENTGTNAAVKYAYTPSCAKMMTLRLGATSCR